MREARALIATLDPVEDAAEITHLSLEVLTPPLFAHAVYTTGFARGMIHPAEAIATYRGWQGLQITESQDRDRDTLTFIGMFLRPGHRSAEIQPLLDRVQQIHHDARGVGNDTQLHILVMLVLEPDRWTAEFGQPDWFSEHEKQARFHFWMGVGEGMGLTGLFDSYDDAVAWAEEFERRHFKPTMEARETYRGQVEGFGWWFPHLPGSSRNRSSPPD